MQSMVKKYFHFPAIPLKWGSGKNNYLSSIMIFGAYCVGKVHNMLPWWCYDNGGILCR